ncbi:hypothetical protein F4560_002059 [Saccharothrix ecbatanensis]|uniref:DUF3995 domain-containing protein n=1 Tax=Saccharothrix ecbatanensis TaxID=1105145 RepID=A0A7W9HHT1_9PSEU|nr:DUF3995 domain-containing protein [Saccharothrix ecbatanensis]MBB5802291.1 hypothetical protein [Saccharothrix ecbatanensis]
MTALALLTAGVLVLVSAIHVLWIFSPWPWRSWEEFGRKGADVSVDKLPPPALTAAVAVLLGLAAYLVVGRAGLVGVPGPSWLTVVGTAGLAAVFLLRGAGGLVVSSRRSTDFARLDLRVYSPLCLALAVSCAVIAFA